MLMPKIKSILISNNNRICRAWTIPQAEPIRVVIFSWRIPSRQWVERVIPAGVDKPEVVIEIIEPFHINLMKIATKIIMQMMQMEEMEMSWTFQGRTLMMSRYSSIKVIQMTSWFRFHLQVSIFMERRLAGDLRVCIIRVVPWLSQLIALLSTCWLCKTWPRTLKFSWNSRWKTSI